MGSSWKYNGFMFGPLYSTLSVQATSMTTSAQQKLVNVACQRVGNIGNSATYYAKSWQVISMMTLNGDASKIGALLRGNEPTPPPSPISIPTTQAPYTNSAVHQVIVVDQLHALVQENGCNVSQELAR